MAYPNDLVRPNQDPRWNQRLTPEAITQVYQQAFGRQPTPEDIAVHSANPGGYRGFLNTVEQSDENQQGRRVMARDLVNPTVPAVSGATSALARPDRDTVGKYYTSFDWNNDYKLDDSAKGTFFYASAPGVGDLRWQRKETAPAWFDQYIRPAYEAKGFKVGEVKGDKVWVHTREDPEGTWVDWVENIDGPNPRLIWQDESYTGTGARTAAPSFEQSRGTYRPQATEPVYNPDGTVTVRVSPEAYQRFSTMGPGAVQRRQRAGSLVPDQPEVI